MLLALLLALAPAAQTNPAINPDALAAHIRFLADDLLEGRETGTRGYELAARYLAAQYATIGVVPAGDNGTYFQRVPFRRATLTASSFRVAGVKLADKRDYLLRANFVREHDHADAPLVFAGLGVVAPEFHHDDYANIDVRGAIVVVISGAPSSFPSDQRAYYSSTAVKEQTAAAHGAIGILTLSSNVDEARYPFEKRAKQSGMAQMRYLDAHGTPSGTIPQLHVSGALSRSGAKAVFRGAPMSSEAVLAAIGKSEWHSFPLKTRAAITTTTSYSSATSENVVAMLPGSDAARRDEYVVVSAHLDHLGNHGTGEDKIYNGAQDNASGIAAMLEIARAFAALPERPARSILFAAVTGEEKGEQGSEYLAEYPPVRGRLVADVNMDMFLMLFPIKDVVVLGGEHSSLGPIAAAAAEANGLTVSPDPIPEEVRFIRSDQYSFVKEGMPAIHLKSGNTSSDPKLDGDKLTKEWLRTIYHTPKDDLTQPLDFATGARIAQTNFAIALAVANAPERPRWNEHDFFGDKFGRR